MEDPDGTRFEVPNRRDERLGIDVVGAGSFEAKPPELSVRERTLELYTAAYVISGDGWFESAVTGLLPIRSGTIVWIFPGVKHSFGPHRRWKELWVLFTGTLPPQWEKQGLISRRTPLMQVGSSVALRREFQGILDDLTAGGPRGGLLAGGRVPRILALATASGTVPHGNVDATRVARVAQLIDRAALTDATPEDIAEQAGLAYSTCRALFRRHTGMSMKQYWIGARLRRAKELLVRTSDTIESIAAKVGYDDPFYFSRVFRRYEGVSPQTYRRQGDEWLGPSG